MKAFLILEDGHVFKGTSIGSTREVISEIVFNTSMTGYLEVMTDPSYAGQAVCMTYPCLLYTSESVKSEGEGIRLVKQTFSYLIAKKKIWLIPGFIMQSGFKYAGRCV